MRSEAAGAGATGAEMSSWLCESAADRERMLDMEGRIRPVRKVTMLSLAVALALCGPWLGYWTVIPVALAAVVFLVADRFAGRIRHPEYAMMAAWVGSELAIGAGVALTGGPASPVLALMAIPIVSLSARFSLHGVLAGVAITLVIMALATFPVDLTATLDDPTALILAAVAVICVGALSTALMRSDLHHRNAAVVDPLTGMLNRKALAGRVRELEEQSAVVERPVGVIVADIDRFKMINDEHGHGRGDAVLVDVAYELRKALRAFDLSYRIGGEEFLMLLPGADADQAEAIGDALRDAIERTPVAGGLHVTASFGVAASTPGEAFDYERTFDRADAALLTAKREGRNCVRVATSRRATASAAPALRAAGASAG
jgi:diguanylate cyclase (GGDEF)-like protein